MAKASAHKLGQLIGDFLEETWLPLLQDYCDRRHLYLDKKGVRGAARRGKKVSWKDIYGNTHDLDFVIEKNGTAAQRGQPVAFIEAAWRRYTKHSRNKSQEIQGAILPIAEKHFRDKPFLGAVLAGVFTEGSLTQMRSSGFEVMLFPYGTIIQSFAEVGIDIAYDVATPDAVCIAAISQIERMNAAHRLVVKNKLIEINQPVITNFFGMLENSLSRTITKVLAIPLHGQSHEFDTIAAAIAFIDGYDESVGCVGRFTKYEIVVRYSNGDSIDATFDNKERTVGFLNYVSQN